MCFSYYIQGLLPVFVHYHFWFCLPPHSHLVDLYLARVNNSLTRVECGPTKDPVIAATE